MSLNRVSSIWGSGFRFKSQTRIPEVQDLSDLSRVSEMLRAGIKLLLVCKPGLNLETVGPESGSSLWGRESESSL